MLSNKTFLGFTQREAKTILKFIYRRFGKRKSAKLFNLTFIASILLTCGLIFNITSGLEGTPFSGHFFSRTIAYGSPAIILNALIDYTSLRVTLRLLLLMTKSTNLSHLLGIIGLDLIVGAIAGFLAFWA